MVVHLVVKQMNIQITLLNDRYSIETLPVGLRYNVRIVLA